MDKHSVFSKTGKGLLEIKNKLNRLPREHLRVLTLVDGKVHFVELAAQTRFPEPELRKIIAQLCDEGFIKELSASAEDAGTATRPLNAAAEGDDLDFTRILGPAKSPGAATTPAAGPQQTQSPQVLRATTAPAARAAASPAAKPSAPQPAHAPTAPVQRASAQPPAAQPAVKAPDVPVQRASAPTAQPAQAQPAPTAAQPAVRAPDAPVQRAPAPVAQPAQSQPAPIAAAPLERDFDAELAELKAAQAQLNVPPKVVQTTPFRARPPAPPVTPPSSASAAGDPSASHDLADAFERARKQAEQHARDEAIRIQQEARERRMRDQRKPK